MFTPPASPAPPRVFRQPSPSPSVSDDEGSSQYLLVLPPRSSSLGPSSSSLTLPSSLLPKPHKAQSQHVASNVAKQRTARRTRWAVLLVPAVLILITLSTRYLSHPAVLDILSTNYDAPSWEMWSTTLTDFKPHKRHASPDPEPQQASSLIAFPTPTTTLTSSASSASVSSSTASTNSGTQTIPTIPASPPTLPTPFPQPLDDTLSQNFTTISCQDFFQNMTQSTAFRSCRAFSLLSQSSDAFIQAQDNITSLNAIVWGTCHTDVDADTCTSNMAWFTDALADQCADDLKAGNPIVQQTQTGLLSYTLLRNTACLPDQTTNAYCYVEAVHNSNPSDLYFYSLPLGIQIPPTVTPSCSACTKSVMGLYAQSGMNLTALSTVYNGAAAIANKQCGNGYVQITAVSKAARAEGRGRELIGLSALLMIFGFW